jgi:hypothetical protein
VTEETQWPVEVVETTSKYDDTVAAVASVFWAVRSPLRTREAPVFDTVAE